MSINLKDTEDVLTSEGVVREYPAYGNTMNVCRIARAKKLPGAKIPGLGWRFSRREIQAYLDDCANKPAETPAESKWR